MLGRIVKTYPDENPNHAECRLLVREEFLNRTPPRSAEPNAKKELVEARSPSGAVSIFASDGPSFSGGDRFGGAFLELF